MGKNKSTVKIVVIAIVIIIAGIAYYVIDNHFKSLPPNVTFTKYDPKQITVAAGIPATIEFDVFNNEDYEVTILIETKFDGTANFAKIENPRIEKTLNGKQNLGKEKTISLITIRTSDLGDSGEITYKGTTTITVEGESKPSASEDFELTIIP